MATDLRKNNLSWPIGGCLIYHTQKESQYSMDRNCGEKHIGPYKVDGYYELNGDKIALEFHGCFWHGCPKCFSKTTMNPVNDIRMGDLYARTMEKKQLIENCGYSYVSMWECDFKRELEKCNVVLLM